MTFSYFFLVSDSLTRDMSGQEAIIRFPAIGDWGGTEYLNYYVPTQEWNAELMDDLCENNTCDMLISLGDNFYETGVKMGSFGKVFSLLSGSIRNHS